MARNGFTASDYLKNTVSAPLTGSPWTIGLWLYMTSATGAKVLVSITDKDSASNRNALYALNRTYYEYLSDGFRNSHATLIPLNTWTFLGWTAVSATDRSLWINTTEDNDTTSREMGSGADSITVGLLGDSTPEHPATGCTIAEVGVWNRALSNAEIASLSSGFAPTFFRNGLVFYAPLWASETGSASEQYGRTLAETGTVGVADHPPGLIYPASAQVMLAAGGAPPAGGIPELLEGGMLTGGFQSLSGGI